MVVVGRSFGTFLALRGSSTPLFSVCVRNGHWDDEVRGLVGSGRTVANRATILDLWSVQVSSLQGVSVEVECLGVVHGCDRLTARWFSYVKVSWIWRVFR